MKKASKQKVIAPFCKVEADVSTVLKKKKTWRFSEGISTNLSRTLSELQFQGSRKKSILAGKNAKSEYFFFALLTICSR